MNNYQKALIEEHSQLVIRTQALHNYIYSSDSDGDDKVEFANKCIQLSSMKKYEEALCARMANAGITYEDDQYFERVASIKRTAVLIDSTEVPSQTIQDSGSDNDVDECKNE